MQAKIVDTIHILGLQKFDNYLRLNPIEITIASNSIKETLLSYRKYKFGFMVESLLFSTNVQSDTGWGIPLWNKELEPNQKWLQTSTSCIRRLWTPFESFSFCFCIYYKKRKWSFNFTVTLVHGSGNKITFPSTKTKVPTLSFKIQIRNDGSQQYWKFQKTNRRIRNADH